MNTSDGIALYRVSGAAGTDWLDEDVLAFTAAGIHAGDGNVANTQLDLPAGRVWGVTFTARVE